MKNIMFYLVSAILFCLVFTMFLDYLDTPILVKSHTTGKCMYWEDASGKHSCNTAPKEYELVWGE